MKGKKFIDIKIIGKISCEKRAKDASEDDEDTETLSCILLLVILLLFSRVFLVILLVIILLLSGVSLLLSSVLLLSLSFSGFFFSSIGVAVSLELIVTAGTYSGTVSRFELTVSVTVFHVVRSSLDSSRAPLLGLVLGTEILGGGDSVGCFAEDQPLGFDSLFGASDDDLGALGLSKSAFASGGGLSNLGQSVHALAVSST